MSVLKITKENFEQEVLQAKGPVLIDFWAAWCGPCKMMGPVVDAFAAEHGDVKVGKINVDEEMELSQKYGIMSIPTIIVFENGEIKNKSMGFVPKEALEKLL